jgi:hypothetical protein
MKRAAASDEPEIEAPDLAQQIAQITTQKECDQWIEKLKRHKATLQFKAHQERVNRLKEINPDWTPELDSWVYARHWGRYSVTVENVTYMIDAPSANSITITYLQGTMAYDFTVTRQPDSTFATASVYPFEWHKMSRVVEFCKFLLSK